jgi:hypothetical protein
MLLVALAMLGAVSLLVPQEASASCGVLPGQTPGSFASAPVVFLGKVLATGNGDREATVEVESIWRGPDMLTYVRVVGTPDPAAQATSVDRTFQPGKRYLFVPENSSSPFQDNNCTATQLYTSALATQAPAGARAPQPGGDPGPAPGPNLLPWTGVGAIAFLVAAGVLVWRWRLRRTS